MPALYRERFLEKVNRLRNNINKNNHSSENKTILYKIPVLINDSKEKYVFNGDLSIEELLKGRNCNLMLLPLCDINTEWHIEYLTMNEFVYEIETYFFIDALRKIIGEELSFTGLLIPEDIKNG
jgi:hypothetical protein